MPMQPITDDPRSAYTAAQITNLLQGTTDVFLSAGLELVYLDLTVFDDISDDLLGGSVTRNSYADLHAGGNLQLARPLEWGSALVRPYLVIANGSGSVTARFNMGVYHTSTPTLSTAQSPPVFDVEIYDILLRLNQPVGDAFAIAAGESILGKVEQILVARGYVSYIIDPVSYGILAPTSRTWAFDDSITWMSIVNDLLSSVGYAGIWSDWNGRLRCEPYILPADRSVEWTYTDDVATTMLGPERVVERDYFNAPNRWVFYLTNVADGVAPVEGNGIYTVENQSRGETSIDQRGGLVITKPLGIDAADQASLIVQGNAVVQSDMSIPTVITTSTFVNPLHWHFDRLYIKDSGSIGYADVQCTEWTINLPPANDLMEQTWRAVSL